MGIVVAGILHLHQLEQFVDPLPALSAWNFAQAEGDVLGHGEVGKQGEVLKYHADMALFRR